MNNEMKKVDIWLQANGLVINLEKTHYIVFHRARIKTKSSEISSRDNKISRVGAFMTYSTLTPKKLQQKVF